MNFFHAAALAALCAAGAAQAADTPAQAAAITTRNALAALPRLAALLPSNG